LEGSEWRDRRVKLSPIFTTGKIKLMFDIVNSIGDKFVESVNRTIASGNEQEVNYIMANYSTDVISNVAFGIDSKCLTDPESEFGKMRHKLFHLSKFQFVRLVIASVAPSIAKKLGIPANPTEPTNFLLKTFLETLKYREESKIQRNDFVNMLLKLRESLSLSDVEMAAESFIFFVGGFETSSSTLTYSLYELAKNQEIQDKLRSEITESLKENEGNLSYDSLIKLQYLDMFVKETLRLYPVIPILMRKCTKEWNVPGTDMIIPKDIAVIIPTFSVQRDPDYYPDPLKFDPERFSPEYKDRNPMTFLAFGEGSRNCIGAR
jgi:cytochrome P450 family 6